MGEEIVSLMRMLWLIGEGGAAPDPCEVSAVCVLVVSSLLLKSVSARFYRLCPVLFAC